MLCKVNQLIFHGLFTIEKDIEEIQFEKKNTINGNRILICKNNITIFLSKNILQTIGNTKTWLKDIDDLLQKTFQSKVTSFSLKLINIHLNGVLNLSQKEVLNKIIPDLYEKFEPVAVNLMQETPISVDFPIKTLIDKKDQLVFLSLIIKFKDLYPDKKLTVKFLKSRKVKNKTHVTIIGGTCSEEFQKLVNYFDLAE